MEKRFLLYSQDYEDWILYNMLKDVENGFYVDVGASSPWLISVTKSFYDRGWNGINIEPLKEQFLELCAYRPRDINLNIGVGNEECEKVFYLAGTGTTCDRDTVNDKRWSLFRLKKILKNETILVRRLTDVLSENIGNENKAIHFCKIDVEGFERSVLEGLDFHRFRPWVLVMEASIPGTGIPSHDKWEDLLLDNGYGLFYSRGINRYYIDRQDPVICARIEQNFSNYDVMEKEYEFFTVKQMTSRSSPSFWDIVKSWETALWGLWCLPGALFRGVRRRFKR